VAAWAVTTSLEWIDPLVLPAPLPVLKNLWHLVTVGYAEKTFWDHIGMSLFRTTTGFLSGLILGIPTGLLMGYSATAYAILSPVFGFIRPIPPIAFIPLVILYFGIGEFSKIVLIGAAAFWYTVLNSCSGVRSVPQDLIRAALNLGVNKRQLFLHVMVPASTPYIFTGIKTAVALSWAIVVAAELVAAQEGIGYIIMDAATFFNIPFVYIGIGIIGLIGLGLEMSVVKVEKRVLHWLGK
jgi:NitT/TauT family transport system permease protein